MPRDPLLVDGILSGFVRSSEEPANVTSWAAWQPPAHYRLTRATTQVRSQAFTYGRKAGSRTGSRKRELYAPESAATCCNRLRWLTIDC